MNEESIAAIERLSTSLGIRADQLIQWFAVKAPYEFVAFGMSAFVAVVFAISSVTFYRLSCKWADSDNSFVAAFVCVVSGIICLVATLFMSFTLYDSVMAIASPEAYAVKEILSVWPK